MPAVNMNPPHKEGLLRRILQKTANKFFTDHAKRWIFISSLVGVAYPKQTPDSHMTEKINEIFHLVSKPEALEFPIYVKSVIWKDCDLKVLGENGQTLTLSAVPFTSVTEVDADKLAAQVVGQTPEWLRYKTYQIMMDDVKRLLTKIQEHHTSRFAV